VLNTKLVDRWYKSHDKDSFLMARRLIREEGLLAGGSSGTAMSVAIQAAKDYCLGPEKRIAVILPDSVRNYINKFLSDDWMLIKGFIDPAANTGSNFHEMRAGDHLVQASTIECSKRDKISDPDTVVLKDDGSIFGVICPEKAFKALLGPSESMTEASKLATQDFALINENMSVDIALQLLKTKYPAVMQLDNGNYAIIDKAASLKQFLQPR
jgi:cystathionine beta-synthase